MLRTTIFEDSEISIVSFVSEIMHIEGISFISSLFNKKVDQLGCTIKPMKANTITNGIIRIILYFLWRTFSPIRIEMGIIKFIGKVYQFISTCEPSKSGSQSRLNVYTTNIGKYRNKKFLKKLLFGFNGK